MGRGFKRATMGGILTSLPAPSKPTKLAKTEPRTAFLYNPREAKSTQLDNQKTEPNLQPIAIEEVGQKSKTQLKLQ